MYKACDYIEAELYIELDEDGGKKMIIQNHWIRGRMQRRCYKSGRALLTKVVTSSVATYSCKWLILLTKLVSSELTKVDKSGYVDKSG